MENAEGTGEQQIPLFLLSLVFQDDSRLFPSSLSSFGPSIPVFCWVGIREGMKSFPAHSGRLIPPIPAPAPAAIPLLQPFQWIFPARMGKGRAKTSFNWFWGFFPTDPFPGSFCFQAEKVFEEVSDQSSFYPKSGFRLTPWAREEVLGNPEDD